MDCAYPSKHRWWASITVETLIVAAERNPNGLHTAARDCLGVEIPPIAAGGDTDQAIEVMRQYLAVLASLSDGPVAGGSGDTAADLKVAGMSRDAAAAPDRAPPPPPPPPPPPLGPGGDPVLRGTEDPYGVLDVPKLAPQAKIRKAFRKMSLLYHPDKNNGDDRMFIGV